ncbi:hypothetical protein HK105_204246 [Polyrhizophydium stewartii]|uniref:Uncharacterized protein n=1 Tax=Polyrhizophydium stewartii TaxID=2732419 RepID=A0ABR4N9G5_9FUNG
MVLIHLKRVEESHLLCEAPVGSELRELVPTVASLYNLRLRVRRLLTAAEDLISHGPLKPENEHGYTEEQLEEFSKPESEQKPASAPRRQIHRNGFVFYDAPDPTGRRIGEAMGEEAAALVKGALETAEALTSKDQVAKGVVLTEQALNKAIDEIRGAVTIVYPEGLPTWEPVREIIEDKEDLSGTAASKEVIDPNEASLWWANKELVRDKKLSDFVGKNDKTKLIIKIQRGPPLREPPLSEQQQKELMAYYYKKQEEQKVGNMVRLAENDEDDYLNSRWADNTALKSAFRGVGDVKWRPF